MSDLLIWLGIVLCVIQSACFSGLNLAFFSLSRLQLEIEAGQGDVHSKSILSLRQDSNFLLTTILWGNVSINVLLTLLSDSVLAGMAGFMFSTVAITLFGEICPQAYFSRNAKRMASLLSPVLRLYQFILYPVAKPCALLLDLWLGKEGIEYLGEQELRAIIRKHIESEHAEVEAVEGVGALNFLAIDDLPASSEGEPLDDDSIIQLPTNNNGQLVFPDFERTAEDPFLRQINCSGRSWVVLTDNQGTPKLVIDADGFLRAALLEQDRSFTPLRYCHRPIVVSSGQEQLGNIILQLKLSQSADLSYDGDIVRDVVLVWTASSRRIITGSDVFGRLLKGINRYSDQPSTPAG